MLVTSKNTQYGSLIVKLLVDVLVQRLHKYVLEHLQSFVVLGDMCVFVSNLNLFDVSGRLIRRTNGSPNMQDITSSSSFSP